ncbi:hypothetical protein ACEWY4_006031 [Coilia grayii]|uniref:Uncharacterized protein n=1 Tax=Coilia grayii TaxID=363190 RepID=A0ABD1KCA3_9TELE
MELYSLIVALLILTGHAEHAESPNLTVVSSWSSSDSCNVSLRCTGPHESLNSSCYTTLSSPYCSKEGGGTFLSITFNHTTISCNHSNPVSWRQTTTELKPLCAFYKGDMAPPAVVSPCVLKTLLLSVVLVAMVTAVITVHIREKLHKAD